MEQLNDMRKYINTQIDPYVKPLIVWLMKNKPDCIHTGIKEWVETDGLKIKQELDDWKVIIIFSFVLF